MKMERCFLQVGGRPDTSVGISAPDTA